MDLNTVERYERPEGCAEVRDAQARFSEGDAWLAGGTWLFSEPQRVRRLIDLSGCGWEPVRATPDGLEIAATCTIAELDEFEVPADWRAGALIGPCCRSFLASFKIWNAATVGGNLCMALPAGPMISLCASLDGVCCILTRNGSMREMPVIEFVRGANETALEAGEVLRSIHVPREALARRAAFRRISLSPMGRSGALVIGTLDAGGAIDVTVTAATLRPVRLRFEALPEKATVAARLDAAIPEGEWFDDIHGRPDWRRHMVIEFTHEILAELGGGAP
jgi:CO/xanthine dehydrogenase FAD-binding subunit